MKKLSIAFSILLLLVFVFAKGHFANGRIVESIETVEGNKKINSPTTVPVVTTSAMSNILQVTATAGGNVTSTGGETLTAKGVCWSTSPGPTTAGYKTNDISAGTGTGVYSSKIHSLKPVTTYYVRAYATNASGTTYGNEISFTTANFIQGVTGGRKYYFAASGNDATGTGSITSPWQTLRKITSITTSGSNLVQPGDTLAFKCGDTFYGSSTDTYAGGYFWNWNDSTGSNSLYFTAPSGTPEHPIVITSYGTGAKPNWLHARNYPSTSVRNHYVNGSFVGGHEGRAIFAFEGVSNIIVDGIQCNDPRIAENDKTTPAYTGGLIIGEYSNSTGGLQNSSASDTTRRKFMVRNFIIRNCTFNNCQYGIQNFAGINSIIDNNTFTNFKASADTFGTHDVGGGAIEGLYGFNCQITNNYIKGAWTKSGRISSTNGLAGVGLDIFTLKDSRIAYNTFIDCSGAWEIGNLDPVDSASGAQRDTFAFNKVVNCGNFGYVHTNDGAFGSQSEKLAIWNNVIISNHRDRQSGPGFGDDIYGDGTGFAQQFWFFRGKTRGANVLPKNPTSTTVKGSYDVTVSDTTGIKIGSVAFAEQTNGDEDTLLGIVPKTTTVVSKSGMVLTLSDTATASRTNTLNIKYYLPVSDTTWSCPDNNAIVNYGGSRTTIQMYSNLQKWWRNPAYASDTIIDFRNNIVYMSTGRQMAYTIADRSKFKRKNNLFVIRGNWVNPTVVCSGNEIRTGERILNSSSKMFVDTTQAYAEDWDLHLMDTTITATPGSPISGFTKDFAGNTITTSFVGLYQPSTSPLSISAVPGTISCNGGTTSVVVTASGGTPPYTGIGTFARTAGTYSFTVTDAVAGSSSTSVTITQPAILSASSSTGTILVYGGTTSATITPSGGTSPYTYSLDGTNYQTSSTISGLAAGTYTVTVRDNKSCTTTTSFTITQPTQLVASATVGAPITCNGGTTTITVSASGGVAPYNSSIGTYTVGAGPYSYTVNDANGASSTVTGTITEPAAITPPTTTDGSRCGTGTVSVQAALTGGTQLNWYAASSGGSSLGTGTSYTTPSISSNTTYYAEASDAQGCVSTRTAATAYVGTIPSAATTSPISGCLNKAVTFSATAQSGATIDWYSAATGGTLIRTGTPSFDSTFTTTGTKTLYALARAIGTTCIATSRTAQVATINALPTAISTGTAATLCGTGSATISATAPTGTTVDWYSNSTATGSPLQTGTATGLNQYTTPTISSTTSYWAFARSLTTGCLSATGKQLTVTVYSVPAAPAATSPVSRCDTGKVTLSATAPSGGSIAWYNVATGGTPLATTTSYTPASFTTAPYTTTYYAAAKLSTGGCYSVTRTPVVVNINPIPTPPTTTSASICGPGTVTLTATATTVGALNDWYTTATSGTATLSGSNTLTASATKTYYVGARISATGCVSKTRTSATATINTVLTAPSTLTGLVSICPIVGTTTGTTYTASSVSGAVLYKWTIPAGAVIDSGSNGLKIRVRFNTASSNDSIYVQSIGSNGCVGTAKKVLKLTTTGCATTFFVRPVDALIVRRNYKKKLNSGK